VDRASDNEPPIAKDLMRERAMQRLVAKGPRSVFHLVLNMGELAAQVSTAPMPTPRGLATLIGPDDEREAPETIELPPHSGCIIRY